MADRQRAGITGNATMRVPITGNVNVGGSAIRELRFMPRSAFPEAGRSDVLYIDTLGECIYYWNGSEYGQLSGGGSGTDNYNALQNRPKINDVTLEGEQTSSDLGLQGAIEDLSSIRSGAAAGSTALQHEDVDTLPSDGSSNPVSSGGTYNFVNSSIATNTAYFIGTFASVADLEAYTGTVTNNDYAFVTSTDSAGNTLYNRYKYNAATQEWSFEYAVNNTAFTAAQWAAIQSGMTSADKTKLDGIETGANKTIIDSAPTSGSSNAVSSGGVYTALFDKQDTISDLSDIRSGASAGATAVQPSALTDYQTKLSGTNKLDPSFIDYDASHRAVSDTDKSTWSGKQDTISDLSTIRSGAAAGATALQQSDVSSTYSASGTAPVNGTAVSDALGTLHVSAEGGSGKYISGISETNGKIAATPTTFDTALSSSSTNSNAPTSKAVYDDQQRQDALEDEDRAALAEVIDGGSKQMMDLSKATSVTATSGISYTLNTDGSLRVIWSIPQDGVGVIRFRGLTMRQEAAPLFFSGCPSGGGVNSYRCELRQGADTEETTVVIDNGEGAEFSQPSGEYKFVVRVRHSTGDITFHPMICTAADWAISQKFVPYAPTNRELYETKASMDNVYGYGNAITSNSNLNDYTHPGSYYCQNATVAGSLTNTPISNAGFRLVVESLTNTDVRFIQTIYANGNDGAFYQRKQTSQGMSSWYKFTGTAVT